MKKRVIFSFIFIPLILFIPALFIIPKFHDPLTVTSYTLDFKKLPSKFDGFKILVLADLHGHLFGEKQEELINVILGEAPDIIVCPGDLMDKNNSDMTSIRLLLEGISGKFPIYMVPGNHDYVTTKRFDELLQLIRHEHGVVFSDGRTMRVRREDQMIVLTSLKLLEYKPENPYSIDVCPPPVYKDEFNILMHHFGNEFDILSDEYDLVLAGHVHGGLFRLFGKGLVNASTKNPFFPKYSKGVYRKKSGSVMVLSAGLGDTFLPRFNNPREIVVITLRVLSE